MLRSIGALGSRRHDSWTIARVVVTLLSFLPFARGLAAGGAFYFRDLSTYFFPLRGFIVEGLRSGEIRRFNPYVNEGVPVALPALGYPFDLLQVLVPNPWGFSLLLALHVPLAALTFLGLARGLGLGPVAATLAAIVYALGGFSLSCVNLYIHLEAFAWAPLMILLLIRASSGRAREVALAGAAIALCLSTTGIEITVQAAFCAFVLVASLRLRDHLRFAASLALGIALAAAPLISLFGLVSGSRRETGFSVAESLELSVHPVSLLQTLISGLYGDAVAGGHAYWGQRFWGPAPYFLSLYLGGAVLCFAALGAVRPDRHRTRLLVLLAAGLLVCLGRFARLDLLFGFIPFLAKFRFPVKAFFIVVVASSLLAGAGADRLRSSRRAWWPLLVGSALVGVGLLSLSLVEPWLPGRFAWLQDHFFAASYPQALRATALHSVAADARAGAAALLAITGLAALTLRRCISLRMATVAATALIAADLLRAGAGLNPTTPASFYALSPEMSHVAGRLRQSGGRVFTCTVFAMPTYRDAVRRMRHPNLWTAGVLRETLSPFTNMDVGIPTTGADPTALVSTGRSLSTGEAICRDPDTLERLREAGVHFILSVQPFVNEALRLVDVAAPARTAPLRIYVYALEGSLPDPVLSPVPDDVDEQRRGHPLEGARVRYLEDRPGYVRIAVEAPRASYLIVRRNQVAGWSATVNGNPAAVVTANGRHQAVAVPSGTSVVALRYRAPDGWLGSAISMLGALGVAVLWLLGRGRRDPRVA